jgi:hypothetical protein
MGRKIPKVWRAIPAAALTPEIAGRKPRRQRACATFLFEEILKLAVKP